MKKTRYPLLFLFIIIGSSANAWADKTPYLSAEESDPRVLQWMVGSPPPPEKLIMQPQSNYFSFPKLRWTVCHIRELLPTKQVTRGLGSANPFNYALDKEIDSIKFKATGDNLEITWKKSLLSNYTDGILILHKGKIVYEKYLGCLNETHKHAAMSMTKSLTGLLAEILIAEGRLDGKAKVSSIIPELKNSAFGSNSAPGYGYDHSLGLQRRLF